MTSLEKEIKELESWVDTNIRRTAWISKKEVLGLVGERADKIREIFDDGFAEAEDQKYALTEQGLGSNIFHVDYDDVKTLLSRLQKEVLAELVEAKK